MLGPKTDGLAGSRKVLNRNDRMTGMFRRSRRWAQEYRYRYAVTFVRLYGALKMLGSYCIYR